MNSPQAETPGLSFSASEILTWPNLFTLARLLSIPVFVWLLFAREHRAAAAWLLGALGSTDWVDGWLARRLDQATEFGAMFDPIVDRLLFFVAVPCLIIDGSVPLVVAGLLLGREALVSIFALILTAKGAERLQVTWEGKSGTFFLMFAFPLFLGAESTLSYAGLLGWLAWLFTVPGLAYSWYSAIFQYLPIVRRALR
ncbi:MAG: CDP-alcohol phosphatidyltransferase family protein [Actinomycetia bacterium]|nr:CDP-alcohol phosphatidyltransferase family protein [Actinomycetes bacterium]MCP4226404.1 CDP-alcohol phosphatidyltransferase family protein [Actinomycetes bacterium]MCP5033477.1 CDP-alcohol phosphatidyltransferase family protein [Actinomycetes bacterium]